MLETNIQNKHSILSLFVIACGLLYIFAYQFILPFRADVFLYGMLAGLVAMLFFDRRVVISTQFVFFILVVVSAFIGLSYTTMLSVGLREAILFTFFAGLFVMSALNSHLIKSFTNAIFLASVFVIITSIVHFLLPTWFNSLMAQILREDAYEQLMWSFNVDNTFAGISAYTPNTTFSAAIVFGVSFLNLSNKNNRPIVKSRVINFILLSLSLFVIIICSKRGIFIATIVALIVLLFFLYRGNNFLFKFLGVVILLTVSMVVLYKASVSAENFFNRFIAEDFTTGRDVIYKDLITDFMKGDIFFGHGTGAAYRLAESGAHNIYLQILYDHGIIFSVPYYIFLLSNYYLAFKNKCPISIFVQTFFLVYGLSGNPLYSNMFMIIYIYYVLYAYKKPLSEKENIENGITAGKVQKDNLIK